MHSFLLVFVVVLISQQSPAAQLTVAEPKFLTYYSADNLNHGPQLEIGAAKVQPVPYETNPLFRHNFPTQKPDNHTLSSYSINSTSHLLTNASGTGTTSAPPEPFKYEKPPGKEPGEELEDVLTISKEESEESSEENSEEEGSEEGGGASGATKGEGGEEEEESSSEGAGGAGGNQQTKVGGQNFINLIGSDFQPGRLVNIFFGLVLLMFMMIAQGYMMWVFGIAFLPGTRSLEEWQFNPEALERAVDFLIEALEYFLQ